MKAFEATELYFNRAADHLDLSQNMRKLLLTPNREIRAQVAVEMGRRVAPQDAGWLDRVSLGFTRFWTGGWRAGNLPGIAAALVVIVIWLASLVS